MHSAVSILLAVVVAVHSVGGFCWQCTDVQASCLKAPVATSVCNCHRAAESTIGRDTVEGSDSCCEFECTGSCRYLQIVRVTVEQSAGTLWIAAMSLPSCETPSRSIFDVFERSAIARGGHPPLRLHLFHGLLLI